MYIYFIDNHYRCGFFSLADVITLLKNVIAIVPIIKITISIR